MVLIAPDTLSTAVTSNKPVNINWFKEAGSPLADWLKKPIASAGNFLNKIADGGKAVIESIRKGTFGRIFNQWAKDDPVAAAAGTIAAGLAAGTLLIVGGAAVGWVTGGIGAAVGALGGGGGLIAGVTLGSLASGIITTAETLYSFNINISDKQIKEDIKAAIDGLYEPAGNFLGRQIGTIVAGGLRSPPKVNIDIDTIALIWELKPELRQELLQNISNFAWQGIQVGITIAIKYAFLHGRSAIKKLWKRMPDVIKKLSPGLDKAIQTWGDDGKEPWSLEDGVNNQIEKIEHKQAQAVTKGLFSGLWQGFSQSIVLN